MIPNHIIYAAHSIQRVLQIIICILVVSLVRTVEVAVMSNECSDCGQGEKWNGRTLVMVLDHINGVNDDNRLENLRMLCPNCNSQTDTFAGRNKRK